MSALSDQIMPDKQQPKSDDKQRALVNHVP